MRVPLRSRRVGEGRLAAPAGPTFGATLAPREVPRRRSWTSTATDGPGEDCLLRTPGSALLAAPVPRTRMAISEARASVGWCRVKEADRDCAGRPRVPPPPSAAAAPDDTATCNGNVGTEGCRWGAAMVASPMPCVSDERKPELEAG